MNAPDEKQRWPWGEGYQKRFQTSEQVEEIVQMLDMDSASGLVDIGCGNGKFAIAVAKRLIIERGAARELGLETKPDGSGVVKLTIFRITGSKEESS